MQYQARRAENIFWYTDVYTDVMLYNAGGCVV